MKNEYCNETASASQQMRDVNSKEIFKNPTLCAQFLRDNMNIPMLKQVQPEGIEDVTERYQAYWGVEFETPTVKKMLLDSGDEMSLLMLLNKLQRADDFQAFSQSPPEKLEGILQNTPPDLIRLIQNVMYSLMMKINIPVAEANEYIKAIGGNQMGYLFENMEKIDIQAERRKTAEARKEREEAQEQARLAREEATMLQEQVAVMREQLTETQEQFAAIQKRAAAAQEQATTAQEQAAAAQERAAVAQEQAAAAQEQAAAAKREAEYKTYITTCKDFNCTKEETINQFILKYLSAFGNSSEEAETIARNKVDHYWGVEL